MHEFSVLLRQSRRVVLILLHIEAGVRQREGIGLIECVRQIREETEVRRFIHAVVENFKIKE